MFLRIAVAGLALSTAMAAAQQQPVYVPYAQAVPHGSAPGMKVQRLTLRGETAEYAIIFAPGDEVMSGLTQFAQSHSVRAAHFTAIGGAQSARLGWYNKDKQAYRVLGVDDQREVAGLIGDIAISNGKPVVHAHCTLSGPDGTAVGGHILELHVWPTLEVFVTVDVNATLARQKDTTDGVSTIEPPAANKEPRP